MSILGVKSYNDFSYSYPLTDIMYVTKADIRSKAFFNDIPVNQKAASELNKRLKIDNSYSELKKVKMISDYVRSKIKKGWNTPQCDFKDWNDPILSNEETGGVCSGYAKLFVMVANYSGLKARVVWLFGHVSAEIYSTQYNKWIAVDVQNNILHQNEKSEYIGYVDFVTLNLTNPVEKISSIKLEADTANDPSSERIIDSAPVAILIDRMPSAYPKMLILNDETIIKYCDMKENWAKVILSYIGFDSIGNGVIYSSGDKSIRHHYLFTNFF